MTSPTDPAALHLPPHVRLMGIVAGKWMAAPVIALAELDVPEALADGPLSTRALAERVGAEPDALGRVLRAAACLGVVERCPDDAGWRTTEVGEKLRAGVPNSLRDFALFMGDPATMASFAALPGTLRGLGTGFEQAHGQPLFEHLAKAPELARRYRGAWGPLTAELAEEAVKDHDFTRFPVLADIGGGSGELLAGLLGSLPGARGVLVERPGTLEAARARFADSPLAPRVSFRPIGELPTDADAYLLKNVLHCYSDDDCAALLAEVADAMRGREHTRLLVIETVVPEDDRFDWAKFIDMEVMANNGGRERTRPEWHALLDRSGFALTAVTATTPPQSIIEARLA